MALAISSTSFSSSPNREIRQKIFHERTTTGLSRRTLTITNATKGVSDVCEPLPPDRPLWFPGSSPPQWLDGSLPGDFGFDPLGLGSDPELLKWFAQAELMHSRWAMLGVSGILIPELLERMGYIKNYSWINAGEQEYFADPTTLFIVQLVLMGWVEGRRWADIVNPGSVDIEPKLPNRPNPKTDVGYPGGLWFDPMMWGRGSPEPVMVLRTKEIKNGRLAMLAFVGFWFQAIYTGDGPIENLLQHLADPGHCNIFSLLPAYFCRRALQTGTTSFTLADGTGTTLACQIRPDPLDSRSYRVTGGWSAFRHANQLLIGDVVLFGVAGAESDILHLIRG